MSDYNSSDEKYSTDGDNSVYDPTKEEDDLDDDDEEDEEVQEGVSVKRQRRPNTGISKRPTVVKETSVVVEEENEKLHSSEALIEAFDECVEQCRARYGHLNCALSAKDNSTYLG